MSVNVFIAVGLFDSPWVVVAFVMAGAIINWLTKRRADHAAKHQAPESDSAAPKPPPPQNWEERLRRILEEQTPPPAPRAAPPAAPAAPTQVPPLVRRVPLPRSVVPPAVVPAQRQTPPPLRPPPAVVVPPTELKSTEPVVRRYELSDAAHAAHAQLVSHRLERAKTKPNRPILGSLRNPQTARQAFATSLVFGPPKGLEL